MILRQAVVCDVVSIEPPLLPNREGEEFPSVAVKLRVVLVGHQRLELRGCLIGRQATQGSHEVLPLDVVQTLETLERPLPEAAPQAILFGMAIPALPETRHLRLQTAGGEVTPAAAQVAQHVPLEHAARRCFTSLQSTLGATCDDVRALK